MLYKKVFFEFYY